jgi:eukaryotic-like serine/threonine-protein kinase
MQSERWEQVKELFAAALERAPGERERFLTEACEDASIRGEVASLLEAHEETEGFIERPALEQAGLASQRPAEQWLGRRVGAWRITGEIGHGGMSRVYKAVRDDAQYEKEAAVKVLRPGLDSHSLLERFKAERQILARLSHPNIAHLLDGGATEEGAPYLVMEYIDGKPIDAYCDAQHLNVEQRLDLFRTLCAAVHYVHQYLMVHGDLKGGNVLVTADGVVKLLDFGIAKLLSPSVAPREAAPSTSFVALTPEYASPEQIRGEPITTASDVYSLGVLLYRLLTGELPYKVESGSSWKLATQILEQEPAPPSITAEQGSPEHRKFVRALAGDLDNIVLKALKKTPEERYSSAEQLSEDLRRYLRGFPVQARPDTTTYRVRKFVQRHRSAVAAIVLFVVSLVGGVVATSWQAYVASKERARAERHFKAVRELATVYMADVYDAVVRLPGGTAARKLLVENSLKYLDSLEQEAGDSPDVLRDVALAYERLAEVQGDYMGASVGDTQAAVESYRRALNLRRKLVALTPTTEAKRAVLRSSVTLSEMLAGQSNTEEALQAARDGVRIADELLSARPISNEDRWQARGAYLNYGWQLGMLGDLEQGLPFMLKAKSLAERFAAAAPDDRRGQRDVAVVAGRIGNVYFEGADRPADALPWYERTSNILEPLAAANPLDAELQRASAFALATIGEIQNRLGRPKEGLVKNQTALARVRKLRDADPEDNFTPFAVAFLLNNLSDSQMQLGDHEAALRSLGEADSILRSLPPTGPDDITEIRMLPGLTYHRLARVHSLLAAQPASASVRDNHLRLSREWASQARDVLTPLSSDVLLGKRVGKLLEELAELGT